MTTCDRVKTTREVAEAVGVKIPTLQKWVRDGLLTPSAVGEGKQRRLSWSEEDAAAAADLAAKGGRASVSALISELAPAGVVPHLVKAEMMLEQLSPHQVIVVGESGPRVFDRDMPVGAIVKKLVPCRGQFSALFIVVEAITISR